ncbi:hypothetical protein AJ79_09766 [Helicocarpus griseus UAMH5409]|uniref:ADP-ribosylglycohydrolase n=1 Tax=Helicocarpus griseus UAMH5409 TaxID=1447875 RepID=A0A2B7WH06_9EURO|nr:hypothetical protein AJ79_09766 [Helicocarpus griseus UAMH5409]
MSLYLENDERKERLKNATWIGRPNFAHRMEIIECRRPGVRGALYGMAVCEAICLANSQHPNPLDPGDFGPETWMAMYTAGAIIKNDWRRTNHFMNVQEIMQWYKEPRTGRGGYVPHHIALALDAWEPHLENIQTLRVDVENEDPRFRMQRFGAIVDKIKAEIGNQTENDSSGLSLAIPVALHFVFKSDEPRSFIHTWASAIAAITHPNGVYCILSSMFIELVYNAIRLCGIVDRPIGRAVGIKKTKAQLARTFARHVDSLRPRVDPRRDYFLPIISRFENYKEIDDWKAKESSDFMPTTSPMDTFEAALWCFFSQDTFKEGLTQAISFTGDAVMISTLYGGLAGAYYEINAIPPEWIRDFRVNALYAMDTIVEGLERMTEGLLRR